jgi:transposase
MIDDLAALGGATRIGIDVVGGIAGLTEAMLAEAGFALVHVPGLAVNRARQGTAGGENKSDQRDARTIADQVRTRTDLRAIEPATEIDLEIRLLVGRRRDLVGAQTQRLGRLHDLLTGIFPGLERSLDLTTKGPLQLLTRYVTPAELRSAGKKRVVRHLKAGGAIPRVEALADVALAAAAQQTISIPAERMTARLIRELAVEALAAKTRLAELDRELETFLQSHPDAALIRSLPGMGAVLTAELIAEAGNLSRFRSADALAAAAGIAPVIRQSGKTRFLRRPTGGNKGLKRVFYQSAFSARSARQTAAPSIPANGARVNVTTRPSSPLPVVA